jgi:hypothetical protein
MSSLKLEQIDEKEWCPKKKLKIGYKEQEIVGKHNFNNNDVILLKSLHDNLNSIYNTFTNYSNLNIKHTLLLQLGVSQFFLT